MNWLMSGHRHTLLRLLTFSESNKKHQIYIFQEYSVCLSWYKMGKELDILKNGRVAPSK